jgi:hypothetical protein
MSKRKEASSKLQEAVAAVESEFLELERLTADALRHPLNSEKHIQQTASSLQGISGMEVRLRTAMAALAAALDELGAKQGQRIAEAAKRAEELRARHEVFLALMSRFRALGTSAVELQTSLAQSNDPTRVDARVVDEVANLAREAESLEKSAEADDFTDVARHASSLRQQLASLHVKLVRKLAN